MSRGRHRQPAVGVLALAVALVACGPAPDAVGPGSPKPGSPTRTAASPSGGPPASPGASPSTAASGTPAPALSPGPGASAGPGSPSPPASGATPSPHPRLARIESKLLNLARITFGQNRVQRATDKAFEGPGGTALIGDQGASVISNNGSNLVPLTKLITDNGAGVVSNNGGNLVSNNGGNIVSNNGGSYRLAQAAPSPTPSPDATIAITPKVGETQTARRLYPEGISKLEFQTAPGSGEPVVRTVYLRDGKPYEEATEVVLERYADAAKTKKVSESSLVQLFAEGQFAMKFVTRAEHAPTSRIVRTQVLPGSFVRDKATGGLTHLERATYDLEQRTASYRYRYAAFGLIEEGTLHDMRLDANGALTIIFWDPMALDDGESVVTDEAGARVYTRRQRTVGGVVTRDFDFGDGITLALKRVDLNHYTGRLSEGGTATADVALESRPDGSAIFTVTFDEAKDYPVTIGFGLAVDAPPSARPSTAPTWYTRVVTLAGADDAGTANGSPQYARFNKPTAIAIAPDLSAFYLADTGNHTIRRVALKGDGAVTTFAGDGTPGGREGARAQAQFNQPAGLAVAVDGTIYVADTAGHRIRAIAPDGLVSTLAGDGTAGSGDGTGAAARLDRPSGLALDAAGRLYVADTGNQLIRRLETAGADKGKVTTVAGGPDAAGLADGTGAAARFNGPTGLALGPDGAIYVADKESRRIRRVTPEGVVTTIAGTDDPAAQGFDGPALASGLAPPVGLAFDPAGLLHVATEKDVRTMTPGGELHTLAGPHVWSIDGHAFQAGFARCAGIAALPDGSALVLDRHRIRLILPATILEAAAAQQRGAP